MSLEMNLEFGEGKHILCGYIDLENHLDPRFDELTYGERGRLSGMIRNNIKPGSHYFFHKTINGQRYITAHYFVIKVMEGYDARNDPEIRKKYKNVHLHPPYAPYNEKKGEKRDIIIFGDKEKSLGELKPPGLLFDRKLSEKLEFATGDKIKFDALDKKGRIRTDAECLCSATRTPRLLTDKDAITLFDAINLQDIEVGIDYPKEQKLLKEGKIQNYYGKRYERVPENRKRAIEIHGLTCSICGFDFEKIYGLRGHGFIEIHHINSLSSFEDEQNVNPATDLFPVCSNCHQMIHRIRENVLSIEDMKKILQK
jgi:hypothetical protein